MFGGSFDVERTIMGWSRKGVPIEKLKAKLQEFVSAPVVVVEDATEGELNGGYSPVGIVNGREKYEKNGGNMEHLLNDGGTDDAAASSTAAPMLVFMNNRWELRLNDDEAAEALYVSNAAGKKPTQGEWFDEIKAKSCRIKLGQGPLITKEKAQQLIEHIESERGMKIEPNVAAGALAPDTQA